MNIGILLPNWVGDACMANPALRAIRSGLSNIRELCVIGRPAPLAVLEGLPWIDSTIVYKPRSKSPNIHSRRSLVRELRRRKFDCLVLLPNSFSSGVIGRLSGATSCYGFDKDWRGWLLTNPVPMRDKSFDHRTAPCIDTYLKLASALGCEATDRRMELVCSERDIQLADELWNRFQFSPSVPTVVFNTSSASAEARLWPTEHAVAAARYLAQKHALQIIVHCGPADRDRANAIEAGVSHPLVRSMGTLDDLPIGLSKSVIQKSSLVVSTDSGPRHIAVALNKPVVSLFGPTNPATTQTFNIPETIVRLGLDCQPCGKSKCPLAHNQCMHGLQTSQVVAAILDRLGLQNRDTLVELQASAAIPRTAA